MRKIGLIAVVAALILVGVGAWTEWVTLDSQARPATPMLGEREMSSHAHSASKSPR